MHNASFVFGTWSFWAETRFQVTWKRISAQNKAKLILTSKFVFVLVTMTTQQKHKMETISQSFMLRNDIVLYRHLTYQSLF